MNFEETPVAGAFVLDLERRGDERGFFARAFCRERVRGSTGSIRTSSSATSR